MCNHSTDSGVAAVVVWFVLLVGGYFPIPIRMYQTNRAHLFDSDRQDTPQPNYKFCETKLVSG